jgi:hypothetical protein
MVAHDFNSKEWTMEYLQGLFGEGYTIEYDHFISHDPSSGFKVFKNNEPNFYVNYHKIDNNDYHYIIGSAQAKTRVHRITCYGKCELPEVYTDEDMVKQAKNVLDR